MKQRVLDRIAQDGPMPFDEYMEMCLYDPDGGFFAAGGVRPGTTGDFVTSPEVSPWFGRLLGRWARSVVTAADATLIEVGSGSGSLLEPLRDEVGERFPLMWAVEVSPAARRRTAERAPGVVTVASIEEVPAGGETVIVVNEVFDNLPTRLVERTDGGWAEMVVGITDGALAFSSLTADVELAAWCDAHLGEVPSGALLAAQMGMEHLLTDILTRFPALHMCVIDYAADTKRLAARQRQDVVRAYHRQRSGFDVLDAPSTTDITLDVNTDVVRAVATAAGARVWMTDQRSFLTGLGAGDVLDELRDRGYAMANAGDVMGQLVARSEATDLRALLEVPGFGGFTVFLVESGS